MVNVRNIDMRTRILGHASSLPVYLSAVAMCKLGHPEGETAWARAAGAEGVIFMIPTLSSCGLDDIVAAAGGAGAAGGAAPRQPLFFQLYVNADREKTERIVRKAEALGCAALFITVDAPQLGNREIDRRVKVSHAGADVQAGNTGTKNEGTSKALTTFIDPSLCWDDLVRAARRAERRARSSAARHRPLLAAAHPLPRTLSPSRSPGSAPSPR